MKITEVIKNYDGTDTVESDGKGASKAVTYRSVIGTALGNAEKDESYDIKHRLFKLASRIYGEEEPKLSAADITEINNRVLKTFQHPLIVCRVAEFLEPESAKS